ncbi:MULTISPECIES: FadR/GntR family transcriptional regulator [Pseudoalteromonas]|uniref:FadR/GntR family transcriptional regulator n=1 Tax=Pseudoalteromonas haloplanktis TaxID=228 RepID=A0ABU1BH02_PSEHA|nr:MULTISPECIES: FadR/GntR family transcriptional regulator [Pseudoalteromonas]MCF6146132.1 GntR family transcriptional regulator, uxuAB operon transcriptional repressor [Pseudoalteromonas mariniglutinosa NCIMB 1770]MDQ9093753.1 FadR/GntR family transcriptional regulator [Pseudoalteromonas haloplanktis]TMN74178.1 FadR family transcriptional regulator [Pseudoalteromonas sp. S1727]
MELQAIKTDRLYVKVAAQLSKLVSDGVILPGDRLPSERELAEKLNVSRPTIREAMIALELSGIVEIRTGSGIYVNEKKPFIATEDKGIGPFDILQIRGIIESQACALAVEHITDEQIKQLKDTILEMEEEEKRPDSSEKADWKFHSIIAEATQNSAITSVVNWLWELRGKSDLSAAFAQRLRAEGVHPSIQDHKDIVDALEKRNAKKAEQAMKKHLENATEAAATYFDNDPFSKIKL